MSGGWTWRAVGAALLLGGCIPPGPPAGAADTAPPPVVATVTPPRLELDLSQLKDERPAWEMRPVTARAIVENGRRYHVVAAGETGIAIARAYALPWSKMVEANRLAEPYVLRVGQRLLLPDTVQGQPPTPEARAAAFQIDIDDLVTGSTPATTGATPVGRPRSVGTPGPAAQFAWPLSGAIVRRFGPQGSGQSNQGIDIAATPGSGVRAAAAGTVAYVGSGVPGYGGLILLRHDGGWISAYGRVATANVAKGDRVAAVQLIGKSTGEPLHFELRRSRVPVDPARFLPPRP